MSDALPAAPGRADAPVTGPLFHPFRLGTLDCIALRDGYVEVPVRPSAPDVAEDELKAFLASQGEDTERRRTPTSCLYVRSPTAGAMLVDAGIGRLPGPAGLPIPTAGRHAEAVAAAGIDRREVETVLLSHLHPDHVGGLFDEADQPTFPRARYHVSREEIAFWSQPAPDLGGTTMPPPMQADTVRVAKRFLSLAGGRVVPFASGEPVAEGVLSLPLEGHTPGQVGFLFDGGGETLLYTADAAGNRSISLQRPDWRFSFDTDGAAAIATRKRLIELAVDRGWTLFTPHFPWPPIGRMVREDGRTAWTPVH